MLETYDMCDVLCVFKNHNYDYNCNNDHKSIEISNLFVMHLQCITKCKNFKTLLKNSKASY